MNKRGDKMDRQMNIDEWFALADKIDMIPNDELARNMRDIYMSIEVMR